MSVPIVGKERLHGPLAVMFHLSVGGWVFWCFLRVTGLMKGLELGEGFPFWYFSGYTVTAVFGGFRRDGVRVLENGSASRDCLAVAAIPRGTGLSRGRVHPAGGAVREDGFFHGEPCRRIVKRSQCLVNFENPPGSEIRTDYGWPVTPTDDGNTGGSIWPSGPLSIFSQRSRSGFGRASIWARVAGSEAS